MFEVVQDVTGAGEGQFVYTVAVREGRRRDFTLRHLEETTVFFGVLFVFPIFI